MLISCCTSFVVIGIPIFVLLGMRHFRNRSPRYGLEVMQMKREYVQLRLLRADLQCDWDDKNATSIATTDPSHLPLVEIPLHALELKQILGKGNFGEVYFAIYNFIPEEGNDPESCKVAVKFPKEGNSEEHKQDIYREAQMLAKMRHPNIIRLLGIVRSQTIGIVSEFMALGDLNGLLRKLGPKSKHFGVESGSEPQLGKLGLEDLVHVAIQVGSGLKYLTDRHFVHRDLATRNCFVGENLTVKIGDFGLSRDVYSSDYYRFGHGKSLLPLRWMPPESIMYRTFSVQSDVWSFGVVLWEIFSYGKQPWFGCSNDEVLRLVISGQVQRCPESCPRSVYNIMLATWKTNPENRIPIGNALDFLHEVKSNINIYLEIQAGVVDLDILEQPIS
ncbi:unnamed protein product [Darwinula stevensoni]|uniref:Tyrosine-protein kinase receptor n=1 Tax=Darwinula stevensoni TaxID=69355 RepID=A0A7R8XB62_9CRUS|nr:unnamed protein product [Darwinula stevensoni]CAG0892548.1 unnamed protein product [Darwinula stevensoni]